MSVLYILIACSLIIAILFLAAFIWAVRNGQYEDKFTPAVRMLFDERTKTTPADNSDKDNILT